MKLRRDTTWKTHRIRLRLRRIPEYPGSRSPEEAICFLITGTGEVWRGACPHRLLTVPEELKTRPGC